MQSLSALVSVFLPTTCSLKNISPGAGELGPLAGMGLYVGYMARPTLYGPLVGPHAEHADPADILKIVDTIHLLLY